MMPQQQKQTPACHGNKKEKRTTPWQQKGPCHNATATKKDHAKRTKENRTTPQQQIQKPRYCGNQKETCHNTVATKTNAVSSNKSQCSNIMATKTTL